MMTNYSHADLVEAARKKLASRCTVVTTEVATTGETADVLGWEYRGSILIECKTSRADFKTDFVKPFRRDPERGMGNCRYYFTPKGLLRPDDLPSGWGLIEYHNGRCRIAVKATWGACNYRQEVRMLLSVLRRVRGVQPEGMSIRCYTYTTKNTATLTLTIQEGEDNAIAT